MNKPFFIKSFSVCCPDAELLGNIQLQVSDIDKTLIPILGGSMVDFSVQATVDVVLFNNDEFVEVYTTSGNTTNNITELVTLLNNDVNTSFLGVFSDDGNDGLEFSMYANVVERFNTFGALNFLVAYN